MLISPWVDLTHSFPSIIANNEGDYIPPYGFRHKPSQAWPPPNSDEILAMKQEARKHADAKTGTEEAMPEQDYQAQDTAKKGYTLRASTDGQEHAYPGQQKGEEGAEKEEAGSVTVNVDGQTIEIRDQIHMYTTNQLLSHPLVSPVLQPSLGGLPPLLILTGGGEMLRDEQIYLAHKAAHPTAYPPGDVYLDEYDPNGETLSKYPPTCVQLQVWDDLCHVAPTLSFTRPAKYMYRSISQFGAWAFARAQSTEIDILVHNDPPISSPHSDKSSSSFSEGTDKDAHGQSVESVGKAGDPLPEFQGHMIRQRVDKRGHVYPLEPPSSFPALQMPASQVGAFNPVLVKRWLAAKQEWDDKFAKEKLRVQQQRMKELYHEFQTFKDEMPPPSSLAARRAAPGVLPPRREKKSYLMMVWSHWASKHDKRLIGKEKAGKDGDVKSVVDTGQTGASRTGASEAAKPGPAEPAETVSANGQPASNTGPRGVTIDVDTANKTLAEERNKRERPTGDLNGSESAQPGSPATYTSSFDKPMSPMIVLPDYDDKKHTPNEENASTRALFHAAGTLPPSASDTSLSRMTKSNRPTSSHTGSIAPTSDASSTIADEKSLAVTTTTGGGFDNASTRALRNSTGVVGVVNANDASGPGSARQSIDALSRTASDIDAVSSVGADEERTSMAGGRPRMPERDVFRTAEEFQS